MGKRRKKRPYDDFLVTGYDEGIPTADYKRHKTKKAKTIARKAARRAKQQWQGDF